MPYSCIKYRRSTWRTIQHFIAANRHRHLSRLQRRRRHSSKSNNVYYWINAISSQIFNKNFCNRFESDLISISDYLANKIVLKIRWFDLTKIAIKIRKFRNNQYDAIDIFHTLFVYLFVRFFPFPYKNIEQHKLDQFL